MNLNQLDEPARERILTVSTIPEDSATRIAAELIVRSLLQPEDPDSTTDLLLAGELLGRTSTGRAIVPLFEALAIEAVPA